MDDEVVRTGPDQVGDIRNNKGNFHKCCKKSRWLRNMRSHVRDQRDNQILVGCSEFVHGRDNGLQIRRRKGSMYREGQHFECSLFGLG